MKSRKEIVALVIATALVLVFDFRYLPREYDIWDAAFHAGMYVLIAFAWFDAGKKFQPERSKAVAGEIAQVAQGQVAQG